MTLPLRSHPLFIFSSVAVVVEAILAPRRHERPAARLLLLPLVVKRRRGRLRVVPLRCCIKRGTPSRVAMTAVSPAVPSAVRPLSLRRRDNGR